MFTGLIEEVGQLKRIENNGEGKVLVIKATKVVNGLKIGDSVAVNGVCLTVTKFDSGNIEMDVMPETLRKSALGTLQIGSKVNLERALMVGDRLGGHIVTGHIDGVGRITDRKAEANAVVIAINAPTEILNFIVPKGSIAIDGISLTVIDCDSAKFTVSIIPHTAEQTTLVGKKTGDIVNLEVDIIGKYVQKMLTNQNSNINSSDKEITLDFLVENGF